VAGSPVRLNATAPTWPSLRDNASARITAAALGLALGRLTSRHTVLGCDEGQRNEVCHLGHGSCS
jgi:hypothetical protein